MKAPYRNSLVYVKLKFIKQIKNPRKVFQFFCNDKCLSIWIEDMLRVHCHHNVTIFNQHWHSTMDNSCRGLHIFITSPKALYILTSFWVLRTPNPGQNLFFSSYFAKKSWKKWKSKDLRQNLAKKLVFLGLHTNTSISL